MKRFLSTLLLTVALPGMASATDIKKSGSWTAYKVERSSVTGNPLCGMYVNGSDKSLHVKWEYGKTEFWIMAWKRSWRIPQGTKMQIGLGFDKHEVVWTTTAQGGQTAEKYRAATGDYVEFIIPENFIKGFLHEFKGSLKMHLSFPSGTETKWSADMTGSDEIADAFVGCMQTLRPPTQPYSSGAPSQPNTQPFGQQTKQPKREDI